MIIIVVIVIIQSPVRSMRSATFISCRSPCAVCSTDMPVLRSPPSPSVGTCASLFPWRQYTYLSLPLPSRLSFSFLSITPVRPFSLSTSLSLSHSFLRLVRSFCLHHSTQLRTLIICRHHAFLNHSSLRTRPLFDRDVGRPNHTDTRPPRGLGNPHDRGHQRNQQWGWVDGISPNLPVAQHVRPWLYPM